MKAVKLVFKNEEDYDLFIDDVIKDGVKEEEVRVIEENPEENPILATYLIDFSS